MHDAPQAESAAPAPARLLIVDDERLARANLARALERSGHETEQAASGEEALEMLGQRPFDVVITDIAMPGMDGMAVLSAVRGRWPDVEVIMVTGYPMVESAVEAMRQGAFHYLAKPFSLSEARLLVARALEKRRLRQQVARMRAQLEKNGARPEMVGMSPAMGGLRQALQRLAPTDVAVLLQGETGTGKELAARTLHALSQRSQRRFLAVNCAALAPELLESELFGHEQGAFSGALRRKEGLFEAAHGGTLFLDEIGEMLPAMQAKLLRVLQEQSLRRVGGTVDIPVDVRLITATNRNLKEEVEAGRFRRDLYYRVAVVTQELPPLRSRAEDIPLLVRFFLESLAERSNSAPLDMDEDALRALRAYSFPGNVRELVNILERAAVFCPVEGRICTAHLPVEVRENVETGTERIPESGSAPNAAVLPLAEVEKRHILHALALAGDNRTLAADMLGISRSSLWRKLREYGM